MYRCKWLPEVTGKEELLSVGFYSSPFPVVRLGYSVTISKASAGVSIRPLAFALSLLCTRTRAESTEPDPCWQRPVTRLIPEGPVLQPANAVLRTACWIPGAGQGNGVNPLSSGRASAVRVLPLCPPLWELCC